ncbi:SDR family oxidoreductase [Flammeovirga sp. SubArs3]|uniref:SDR family oxidoreductase n=1 Tax=Flammeovirga sp. SubArs3 TaxID=2995316 RepID=UPI00248CA1A0|nr:SDR family oxidoreductase [Flammeovirga sp. SubArs3]
MNILITGAGSGLGRVTTEALLKSGYNVIASMRDSKSKGIQIVKELEAFSRQTKGTLFIIELDVTSTTSVNLAISQIESEVGQIDVLINNAGIGGTGWTEAFPEEQYKQIFDVNVFGVQRMMRGILPSMRKRKEGLIINISSIQGRVVFPYSGIYTASKFALEGLTESYHYELAPLGIDIILLQPGGFKTSFESKQSGPYDKDRLLEYGELKNAPNDIWGNPGEEKDFLPSPQPIPEAIMDLIEMEKGKRPLRTTVDPLLKGIGTIAINKECLSAQKELSDYLEWDIKV